MRGVAVLRASGFVGKMICGLADNRVCGFAGLSVCPLAGLWVCWFVCLPTCGLSGFCGGERCSSGFASCVNLSNLPPIIRSLSFALWLFLQPVWLCLVFVPVSQARSKAQNRL